MNVGMNVVSSMNQMKPHMAGILATRNAAMKSDDGHEHAQKTHLIGNLAGARCCKLA